MLALSADNLFKQFGPRLGHIRDLMKQSAPDLNHQHILILN